MTEITDFFDRLRAAVEADPDPLGVNDDEPTIAVHTYSAYLPISLEMAMDAGLITEEQARAQGWTPWEPVKVPWRKRLRWRWQSWRETAGRKIGGWIAGVDLSERDDDY